MALKLLAANLVLCLVIVGLGFQLALSWKDFAQSHQPESLLSDSEPDSSEQTPPEGEEGATQIVEDYVDHAAIAERNLFSPDRRPPLPEEVAEGEQAPPPLPREPVLHGTSSIGERKVAYITQFAGRTGQGTRKKVSLGDIVNDYTVSDIASSSMTLKWNEHEIVIAKSEADRRQPRGGSTADRGGVKIVRIGDGGPAVDRTTASAGDENAQQAGLSVTNVGNRNQRANPANRQQRTRPQPRPQTQNPPPPL